MRYQNWDVLLFPQEGNDTKTPLQEFKTCCEIVQDPSSDAFIDATNPAYYNAVTRALPTVSCYVPSLPCGHAFRVSLHCWSPPELTKATASMGSKDDLAVFEAKVLLDGTCVAGLVFGSDAHWPQIIDNATRKTFLVANGDRRLLYRLDHKDSKPGPLKFPPFHPEMLSQAWVLPGQSMGRIKVVVAEGISHGPAGTTPFEKTRNLVAFSFQHTPLKILEESGVAWPNPGMFYQILHQDLNPLSPHKDRDPDPDSHAHSPRHCARRDETKGPLKLDVMVPPPSFSYGMMQPGMMIPPPPCRVPGPRFGDPFHPQYSHHDPFSGIDDHVYRRRVFQDCTRRTSSSGDISMQDLPPKSRSTISDEAMLDYVRPQSPVGIYKSYEMNDYPQILSLETHRGFAPIIPPNIRPQSPGESRQVSSEFLKVPRMQPLFSETGAPGDHETLLSEPSQFTEMVDAMSPRKVHDSGCYSPVNTRASSATNTPPPASRSSAATEARASSYIGKNRSVANTTRDLPPSTYSRQSSEIVPKARSKSRKSDLRQSEIGDEIISNAQKVVKKAPSTSVKSRKENRTSEIGHEDSIKSQRRASGSALIQDKENIDTLHPSTGDNKRRRVNSSNVSPGTPLGAPTTQPGTPIKIGFNINSQTDSLDKINEIDVLTAEGVVVRAPLGDMDNMV